MKKGVFKQLNWQYAIGEIILIFLGISMAIAFNNWNEAKKLDKIELKTLNEIKNAINQDLVDIEENIFGFGNRVNLYNRILTHMEEDLPLSDSLKLYFPYLQGMTTFLSNIGAYETLKSRGLETISSDSIRLKISLYYDFEHEKILSNQKQHFTHYEDYIKPAIVTHFDLSDPSLKPLDFNSLKKNFEFQQTIWWALRIDGYMLKLYKDLQQIGKSLVENIEKETERLQ